MEAFADTGFESTADILLEEEGDEFATTPVELPVLATNQALITIEEAREKLGDEILETLRERFNGKLTEVRHTDAKDKIF